MNGIMDKKIKLLAVASIVAVMASGCSNYRGFGSQYSGGGDGYSSGGSSSGQAARTGQVSRGGLFGQRRAACGTCATNTTAPKSTYTYKPAAKPVYKAAAKPAGQHNQQYYIDRWNRQQAAQNNKQKTQNYTGYGSGNYNANAGASNTNYYDYSSAGKTATAAPAPAANVSASNKSIYTGSYQQPTYKPYQPTTYSGGSTGTTNTASTYNAAKAAVATGGNSSYRVKKGDTVFEVMRQTGVYWKDIISMNNLTAPYTISPGQTLRLK